MCVIENIKRAQEQLWLAQQELDAASHLRGVDKFRHQKLATKNLASARRIIFEAQAGLDTEIIETS